MPADPNYTNTFTIKANGDNVTQFNQSSNAELNLKAGNNITLTTGSNTITINANWGWTSLWEIANVTNGSLTIKALKPKDAYLSNNMYISGDIYHDWYLRIMPHWVKGEATVRMNDIYIHRNWVSIWEMANKTAWFWVHWPITVGKYITQTTPTPWWVCRPGTERNTISIYASWAAWTDNFEILWSPRILVGVKNWWFMYFDNESRMGINRTWTHATLDINWSIRVWNCSVNNKCNAKSVWEIKYYQNWNTWYFIWCRYRQWSQATNNINDADYEWVDLTNWQRITSGIWNSCSFNTPYNSSIYESTIAQQTICK